jgi:hypothetical protein
MHHDGAPNLPLLEQQAAELQTREMRRVVQKELLVLTTKRWQQVGAENTLRINSHSDTFVFSESSLKCGTFF